MKTSSRLFNAMRRYMRLNRQKQKKTIRQQKTIQAKEYQRAKASTPTISTSSTGPDTAKVAKEAVNYTVQQKKKAEAERKRAEKKAEREAKRRERLAKLQDTLNKRYTKLADKYALPLDEVIAQAGSIEGVSLSEDGKSIIIDPDKATAESIRSLKATLPSEIAIKKEIAEEVGATDAKAISKEKMRKAIQNKLFYDKEDSIFTKYYDYFEHKDKGSGAIDMKKYNKNPGAYIKAADYMTELGREVQKNGFTDDYRDLKEKIENLFAEIDEVNPQ